MSVRNLSDASFPLAPGHLRCPSLRTGLQRYCFFPNLQIFLNFFLTFFPVEDRRGRPRTGPGTAQRAGRQRNHGTPGGAELGCDFFEGGDREMIHLTAHLARFSANTAAGGASDVSPGSISRQYHGRWEENDTSYYPPDSLLRK